MHVFLHQMARALLFWELISAVDELIESMNKFLWVWQNSLEFYYLPLNRGAHWKIQKVT
jgi:hypothetical protein